MSEIPKDFADRMELVLKTGIKAVRGMRKVLEAASRNAPHVNEEISYVLREMRRDSPGIPLAAALEETSAERQALKALKNKLEPKQVRVISISTNKGLGGPGPSSEKGPLRG